MLVKPHAVRQFVRCPRMWAAHELAGIPQKPSMSQLRTKTMHEHLRAYLIDGVRPSYATAEGRMTIELMPFLGYHGAGDWHFFERWEIDVTHWLVPGHAPLVLSDTFGAIGFVEGVVHAYLYKGVRDLKKVDTSPEDPQRVLTSAAALLRYPDATACVTHVVCVQSEKPHNVRNIVDTKTPSEVDIMLARLQRTIQEMSDTAEKWQHFAFRGLMAIQPVRHIDQCYDRGPCQFTAKCSDVL